jgi:hypothetical protein
VGTSDLIGGPIEQPLLASLGERGVGVIGDVALGEKTEA